MKKASPHQPRRGGFTLVQTIIVIGLIAVLTALLLPVFQKAIENSRQAKCASNLRQIYVGTMLYAQENNGWLPWAGLSSSNHWWKFIQPYVDPGSRRVVVNGRDTLTGNVWRCPSTAKNQWIGYGWNYQGLGMSPSDPRGGPTRVPNERKGSFVLISDCLKAYDPTAKLGEIDMIYPSSGKNAVPKPHRGGLNTVFLDGHVSWYPAETYYDETKTRWQ